ncbi:MAG: phospho-sugar mutase [Bacteroidetes bacterium]|jgi:phosphoglucomutase|uniref:Phospho-sugar mutase n=1 Tax=Candidatus Cryptobacteroides avicola TaxID=2840757 RepID=A0A940DSK5_9BACT|nr:phospho-sugar mutase [Candidatus Cryptobacteroides avicola]
METTRDFRQVAQSWLDGNYDEQTKSEVRELMEKDPAGLEDAFYRNLEFGTGGLRGVMGVGTNRMNKYTVGMATQGLANYIRKHCTGDDIKVCVSYDCRNHSKEFAKITADVFSANGLHVYLFESLRPTPELSYSIRKKGAQSGVMVTASHNPKEYNGYKVYWSDGAQITSPVDKDIVAEVNAISDPSMVKFVPGEGAGKIEIMGEEVDNSYLDDILSLMLSPEAREKHKDLKIVYTPLHGTGVRLVPMALKRLGFENIIHVPEQDVNDGDFPTVMSPNPEEPSALKMAVEAADREHADIVLATDPDADRMGIAVRDNDGKMVLFNGNQTGSMLTYYILNRWKELGKLDPSKYVVKTIVTTELIRAIAEKFGVKVYNVLTGFKYIAEIVKQNEGKGEFICGGEESYGFNVGEYVRDKDAVIACSMVAECACWAAEQGLTLYQLMQKIYKEFGYYRESLTSLVRKGKAGVEEIAAIMTDMRNNPPKDLAGSPVVKVVDYNKPEETGLPKSNVLQFFSEEGDVVSVRPSGTEPKIKFYFGAKGDSADAKIEKLRGQFIK